MQHGCDLRLVLFGGRLVEIVRMRQRAAADMRGGLHARARKIRKAVDVVVARLEDEDREDAGIVELRPARRKPADDLARHGETALEARREVGEPRTGCDDDAAHFDGLALGAHDDRMRLRLDGDDAGVGANLGAALCGGRDEAADRSLGLEKAAIGLEQPRPVPRQVEARKAARHLPAIHHLARQIVQARRGERVANDLGSGASRLEDAGDGEKRSGFVAVDRLEGAPFLVGAPEQRHVGGILEIRQPDDAALAVRRAAVVTRLELLEADDALPAFGELIERGAASRAEPDHRGVERRCHGREPLRVHPASSALRLLPEA